MTADTINWDEIHPRYKSMVRTPNDDVILCTYETPTITSAGWNRPAGEQMVALDFYWAGRATNCLFTSYVKGDNEWQDSLVQRSSAPDPIGGTDLQIVANGSGTLFLQASGTDIYQLTETHSKINAAQDGEITVTGYFYASAVE